MSIDTILSKEAERIAKDLLRSASALQTELRGIEKRKIEIDAQLNATKLAAKRLLDFQPNIGNSFRCPRCWIEREASSVLDPVRDTTSGDTLRCVTCGTDFVVP